MAVQYVAHAPLPLPVPPPPPPPAHAQIVAKIVAPRPVPVANQTSSRGQKVDIVV